MKIFNPTSKWEFGSYFKNVQMYGNNHNANISNLASDISMKVKLKRRVGNKVERVNLSAIKDITYERTWVKVNLIKGATLKQKRWIRVWLVKNGYIYKDKPYNWTINITNATASINLGPWSKKPWVINGKQTHNVRARYI